MYSLFYIFNIHRQLAPASILLSCGHTHRSAVTGSCQNVNRPWGPWGLWWANVLPGPLVDILCGRGGTVSFLLLQDLAISIFSSNDQTWLLNGPGQSTCKTRLYQ